MANSELTSAITVREFGARELLELRSADPGVPGSEFAGVVEAVLSSGAAGAIDINSPTWRDDLKAANGGKGVDVVIDPNGGPTTELAFRSLAWNGRLLVVGFAAGSIPKLPVNLALLKGASLIGVDSRQFHEYEPAVAAQMRIDRIYPIEDFVAAINLALTGKPTGRIAMRPGGDG